MPPILDRHAELALGQATANILKVAIAKEFGVSRGAGIGTLNAFVGLENGTVDIHPEVWQPNLDDVIKKFVTDKGVVDAQPSGACRHGRVSARRRLRPKRA
jgi:ABC-type proline/glycine betaine transport system substrate-binding protein